MSQAEDLLTLLSETMPEHAHVVKDSDSYFVIDPVKRTIKNSSGVKKILIQNDHASEVITFEFPRYIDNHDMLLCNHVKVHYNNIDEQTGEQNADVNDLYDLQLNPDNDETVICSWTIKRQATQLIGILSFLVQYICTDENDGTVVYEWNTGIQSDLIEIKEGLNNGEATVIEYSDILEQWRAKLFTAGVYYGSGEMPEGYVLQIDPVDNTDEYIAKIVSKALEGVENGSY